MPAHRACAAARPARARPRPERRMPPLQRTMVTPVASREMPRRVEPRKAASPRRPAGRRHRASAARPRLVVVCRWHRNRPRSPRHPARATRAQTQHRKRQHRQRKPSTHAMARHVPLLATMTESLLPCDPLSVEDAEAEGDGETRDDPEPDHDGHLGPTLELEMVLQRGHLEYPAMRHLEVADLNDARHRDDDEQTTEHRK